MVFVMIWLICGVVSAMVADSKGRSGAAWFFIGMLFGPLGVLGAIGVQSIRPIEDSPRRLEQSGQRPCPQCAEPIRVEAIKCKHCGSAVEPLATAA